MINSKIAFLGSSDLGLLQLRYLLDCGYKVELVTGKSTQKGHSSDAENSIKDLCSKAGIRFLGNINVNEPQYVRVFDECDLCIIGGYDGILKTNFISQFKNGVINTHFGIIPKNRGCNPVIWSILYGEKSGYTIYFIDKKIDLGEPIFIEELNLKNIHSAKFIYDTLTESSLASFKKIFTATEYKAEEFASSLKKHNFELLDRYHRKGMPNNSWISWYWKPEFLIKFTNALTFPPYSGPRTRLKNLEIEIFPLDYQQNSNLMLPGKISCIHGDNIYVQGVDCIFKCRVKTPLPSKLIGMVFESLEQEPHPIPILFKHQSLK